MIGWLRRMLGGDRPKQDAPSSVELEAAKRRVDAQAVRVDRIVEDYKRAEDALPPRRKHV